MFVSDENITTTFHTRTWEAMGDELGSRTNLLTPIRKEITKPAHVRTLTIC
jgi:hypothetical protein